MDAIIEAIHAEMDRLAGRRAVNEKLAFQETGDGREFDQEKLETIKKLDRKIEALDKAADLLIQARVV